MFSFLSKEKIKNLPALPGVYRFNDKGQRPLYIGKAINLKKRIENHRHSPFWNQTENIGYSAVNTEIEALILESSLIRKFKPKYNIIGRDSKNYAYAAISREKLPIIFISRRPETKAELIGPFIESRSLKIVLRLLKKIFPYYEKSHDSSPCPDCRLGFCPGPNPDPKDYRRNIRRVRQILTGEREALAKDLRKEMLKAAQSLEFEKAARIRNQVLALEKIFAHRQSLEPKASISLQKILGTEKPISRIEAYDISNIQGESATGSMVCFKDGRADKNLYRRFKVRISGKPNDIAMIKEILARRFSHQEWPCPELILIDGGKAQLNAALGIKEEFGLGLKVASLAKKQNQLFIENRKSPLFLKSLPRPVFNLILQLRDEAHRFALNYHLKLRKKKTLGLD